MNKEDRIFIGNEVVSKIMSLGIPFVIDGYPKVSENKQQRKIEVRVRVNWEANGFVNYYDKIIKEFPHFKIWKHFVEGKINGKIIWCQPTEIIEILEKKRNL